ncbi:DUF5675 family protein [Flagellimonas aurea]|uniref:DUF5675 family protein n=1 Tax=Flagellimonas aurea TaxID=2915619 RepID=UPI0035CECB15
MSYSNLKAVINRLPDNDETQTLGHFILYDGVKTVMDCKSLELPDRDNQRNISRVPSGKYNCTNRYSSKYGHHFLLNDVEGRSLILIHLGNYKTDTRGCILLGTRFSDIDKDGHLDVTNSRNTMARLLSFAPDGFTLHIHDLDV